jgi:hypothetical protein
MQARDQKQLSRRCPRLAKGLASDEPDGSEAACGLHHCTGFVGPSEQGQATLTEGRPFG